MDSPKAAMTDNNLGLGLQFVCCLHVYSKKWVMLFLENMFCSHAETPLPGVLILLNTSR